MEFGPFGARRPSAASRRKRGRRDGAARFTQRASVVAQPGTGDIPLPKVQPWVHGQCNHRSAARASPRGAPTDNKSRSGANADGFYLAGLPDERPPDDGVALEVGAGLPADAASAAGLA